MSQRRPIFRKLRTSDGNRLRTYVCMGVLMLMPFLAKAQSTSRITLEVSEMPVELVIKQIETNSPYRFVYSRQVVDVERKVSVKAKNQEIKAVLDKLFSGTNTQFTIEGVQVVLSAKKSAPTTAKSAPTRMVSGVVVDTRGETVIGASILVKGTSTGTVTDIDGRFTLEVPQGSDLQISYIGYSTKTVSVADGKELTVALSENTEMIDEVVVTALGIKREKKLLGYAVQELKSDELNKTGDPSVSGALQGKVAGVEISSGNTGLNGSTKITIRGNSSLTDNNQPLWVVDGIPFSDENNSGASLFGGLDRGGSSIDLNPEDIESISVLKGPNAAALYGSRAGNGVILVTTKKGTKTDGFGVTYSGSFTTTMVAETLHMQDKYGQGVGGAYDRFSEYSFGGALDGSAYTGWDGEQTTYSKQDDKLQDYFRDGFSASHNVSVGNVNDKSNYRLSFGHTSTTGIFHREGMKKINIDLKAGTELNKYLSVDSKISLSRTKTDNRPNFGKGGEVYQLMFIPNNIALNSLRNYKNEEGLQSNWVGPFPEILNPYFVSNQYTNMDDRWRSFGYMSAKLNITSWLFATAKYAFDYHQTTYEDYNTSSLMNQNDLAKDSYTLKEANFFESNAEFMLFANHRFNDQFNLSASLGGNLMDQYTHYLQGGAENMLRKGITSLNSAQGFNYSKNRNTARSTYSVFGTAQLVYNDIVSLDVTARNDWSSTLPILNNSYFYPSASLSFIATEMLEKLSARPSWFTFGKLRLSYAQVGKDTGFAELHNLIEYERTPNGPKPIVPKIKANSNLKPEISSSYEVGLDMRFLKNRLGFDFTYYNSSTKNQIMVVPTSGSFEGMRINAGEIQNSGIELALYSTIVKTKDFNFDLNVNFSHNNTLVKSLHPDVSFMSFNFRNDRLMVDVGASEGGRLGDIYPLKTYVRNEQGQVITRNGMPMTREGTKADVIGNIQPDFMMSISPSFSYKGIYLSALIDIKKGGDIVSMSESVATGFGTAKRTEMRDDIIVPGVNEDGTPNTIPISAEQYYKTIGGGEGIAEEFLYDASFVRLKELSIGYSFPKALLKKAYIGSLRLSIVGRNLFYLMKNTPGTSPEGGFDTTMFSQAIDFTSVPYSRSLGFSINLGF